MIAPGSPLPPMGVAAAVRSDAARCRALQFGVSLPPFREPGDLVGLAVLAEARGWDGCFLWDHIVGSRSHPMPIVDPWVTLGAIATSTARIRIGTMVTPLPRRRPQVVAREIVTLDRLSGGRVILGAGIGSPIAEEYGTFGEDTNQAALADMLDESLTVISGLCSGQEFSHTGLHYRVETATFIPGPVQKPRIPVWLAATVPHRRPLLRAARWDGAVLARVSPGTDTEVTPDEIRHSVEILEAARPDLTSFDVALVSNRMPTDVEALAQLGVTWWLVTGWGSELDAVIDRGPQPVL